MATDLAKLSLWLVTLSKDEDFSFLDHALKTGDSLVGLSLEQINGVSWQEGITKPLFANRFVQLVNAARTDRQRIRTAPDNVTFEQQRQRLDEANRELAEVRLGGDAVIVVFFSQNKAKARKEALDEFQAQLGRDDGWEVARRYRSQLASGEHPISPFHWQIEFPEVFEGDNPGFDAIVGNPPFAGKNTITSGNRTGFLDWLKVISPGAHGNADLVAHFFRRAYGLIRKGGTMGLIATNTIGQGDTRESGLRYLLVEQGGEIYRAKRRVKWAGDAAVVVSNRFHKPLDHKPDILELRRLHGAMDDAVLRAYGWDDLAELAQDTSPDGAAPRFLHQTDEPEFAYQKRYHWPAWFRDKVLARLLQLNRSRAATDASTGSDEKLKPKALQLEQKGPLI